MVTVKCNLKTVNFTKRMIVFFVFWGEEFDYRIHFFLKPVGLALRDHAIFDHIEKFSCQIGQNIGILGKS